MKRDMSDKLFILCQICGFKCNYKSINNRRSQRTKTILKIRTIILNILLVQIQVLSHLIFLRPFLSLFKCIYKENVRCIDSFSVEQIATTTHQNKAKRGKAKDHQPDKQI